eukprot:CAMPEP_0114603016 /NCGR_PEP_ID=MMETSP0125-20121206/25505_1 /TAXON_ID=485358 ORGANISM="Aristerostoma sp., Strain ATCC 50986" /NCGR_SAMPLE_ID=MMETSP0125 /ASSEMBLY_ACC=CAM_ASM_000245 /LENGTH=57 /DNA_ID=CAMNT_0001813563 /DNA_START=258 /DNA_END=427 /DNA_ORIENTATION=-
MKDIVSYIRDEGFLFNANAIEFYLRDEGFLLNANAIEFKATESSNFEVFDDSTEDPS